MGNTVNQELSELRAQLGRNTKILSASWIIFSCLFLFSAFQSASQLTRVHSLRIVDDSGNDVIRLETVKGEPLIQLRTASLATTINSGKVTLDWKDTAGNRATSVTDFVNGEPRIFLTRQGGKQTAALSFDKTRPTLVLNDRILSQFSSLQSGAFLTQNGEGSQILSAQLEDRTGPTIRLTDTKNHLNRLGVVTSDGVGSKVDGATTELRTANGSQLMSLKTA